MKLKLQLSNNYTETLNLEKICWILQIFGLLLLPPLPAAAPPSPPAPPARISPSSSAPWFSNQSGGIEQLLHYPYWGGRLVLPITFLIFHCTDQSISSVMKAPNEMRLKFAIVINVRTVSMVSCI